MAVQGSAVSLQSDTSEPLMLARGGKAHSWDATATRTPGRRSPSASRSMDVRASIEPQVSSILEMEPPALGTDQPCQAEGSRQAPASVLEAAASLSAPSQRNEPRSPRRFAAASPKDVSPSRKPARRQGSLARGPSMLGQGQTGSADLAARSALYTPAKLKDDQQQQQ